MNCIDIPENARIALLPQHTHSDEALNPVKAHAPQLQRLYRNKIEEVFDATSDGETLAWVPTEVGDNGLVWDHINAMPDQHYQFLLTGDHNVDNRVGVKKGNRFDDIQQIYSYRPALNQCSRYIERSGAITHDAPSTAGAAEIVSGLSGSLNAAAISTRSALQAHGLLVSNTSVNNRPPEDNITQFALIKRMTEAVNPDPERIYHAGLITVREYPGALRDLTGIFKFNGIDLISLHSDKEGGGDTRSFFVEMKRMGDPEQFATALRQLDQKYKIVESVQWLGSWDINLAKNGVPPPEPQGKTVVEDEANLDKSTLPLRLVPYNVPGVLHDLLCMVSGSDVNITDFESENLGHKRYAFTMLLATRSTTRYKLETLIEQLSQQHTRLSHVSYANSIAK